MKPETEPLDPEVRALLDATEPREPTLPDDVRERMRLRLEVAMISADRPAGETSGPRAAWPARVASLLAAAAIGAAGGAAWHGLASRSPASERPPVVDTTAPPPVAPSEAPLTPPPEPSASPAALPPAPPSASPAASSGGRGSRDDDLSAEAHLIEVARAALVHRDFAAALSAAERHAGAFPRGRLTEEREAIAIQALAGLGRTTEAAARANAFR